MKTQRIHGILTILFIHIFYFLSIAGNALAGSIEGFVLDGSSNPIGNLTVGAYLEYDEGNLIKYVETDSATGKYTLDNLPDDTYKIVFFTFYTDYIQEWYNSGSDAYSFADAEIVNVAGGLVTLDDTILKKGAKITGTITEEGSGGATGIADITAIAYDSDGNWVTAALPTDTDGVYSLSGLREGDYKGKFRANETSYATEWQNDVYTFNSADTVTIFALNNEVTINAELGPGSSISGTVTDSEGAGIVGALVKVYDSSSDSSDSPIEFATTGADGIYTVTGLPASGVSFKVQFFSGEGYGSGAGLTGWYDHKINFDTADIVTIGDTGIDAMLESRFKWLLVIPELTRRPAAP